MAERQYNELKEKYQSTIEGQTHIINLISNIKNTAITYLGRLKLREVRTRFENLKRSGIKEEQAWMWANTRKGYWRTAHSPILLRSLSNERFKRAGYLSLMECYSAK